jgi:polysaccharide export outer membrane protein
MAISIRGFFALLAAVSMSACSAPSLSDSSGSRLPPSPLAPQPSVQQPKEAVAEQPESARDQDALRKVVSLASMSDPGSKTYKIGPRDTLEVTVFKSPELSKTVQVSETGTINFPLIGELYAAGKTAREVEQEMTKKLGAKYLQNPQISVLVKDYFSQRITMEGAVKKPGVYPIAGGLSLLQALAQAGGFEDTASHTVVLFRQVNGQRLAARYDVSSIRDGSAEDPQLEAGDVIIVSTSELKEGMNMILKLVPLATLAPYL